MRNKTIFAVKALVSLALIAYLLSGTDFAAIYESLISSDPLWLLLALVTLYIGKILTGYRWRRLLAAQGINIPLRSLIASVFVGQFFNSFLPTTVGGDAMRAYDTAIQSKQTAKSVTSVFTDRLIGVFALALLSILALGVAWLSDEDISFYAIPVVIVFGICAIGILLIFDNRLMALLDGLLRRARLAKLADKVSKAYGPLYFLKDKRDVLLIAFVISIVLQINVVLFYYFIGVSLHLQVSLLFFFIIVPIALVVLLVPFTINGIGLREGVFVFLLTELGVSSQDAIALSLLSFALTLTQGITGGIIFALRGVRLRTGPAGSPVPPEPRGDA